MRNGESSIAIEASSKLCNRTLQLYFSSADVTRSTPKSAMAGTCLGESPARQDFVMAIRILEATVPGDAVGSLQSTSRSFSVHC